MIVPMPRMGRKLNGFWIRTWTGSPRSAAVWVVPGKSMQTFTSLANSTVTPVARVLLQAYRVGVAVDDGPARSLVRHVVRLDPVEEHPPEAEQARHDQQEHRDDQRELRHRHAVLSLQIHIVSPPIPLLR